MSVVIADMDGYTNKQEHDAQTDPGDPNSQPDPLPGQPVLLITSVSPSQGKVTLRLYGSTARMHRIEWSLSLTEASWQALGTDFVMPPEGFVDIEDSGIGTDQRRFYRASAW